MHTTEADPALLLQELAWARRLALHLTRDEAWADDLAQEAFVVAHVKPPRPDQPLRPWLGRVVRNLLRMQLRGDGRRRRREQVDAEVVVPEGARTDELLERLEAQRRLVGLVQQLEEPLRMTLLLHYYEGLSCADIARRLGVPDGTVRWRLKAGLDRLRERLDDSYGKRAMWIAALAQPLPGWKPMNPIPALKIGLALTAGVAGVLALSTVHHNAVAPAPVAAAVTTAAVVPDDAVTPVATRPAVAAKKTAPPATKQPCPSCSTSEDDVIVTSVYGHVDLDDKTRAALVGCFGPDVQGRIDFDLSLSGSGLSRVIEHAQAVSGDRESVALQHPAVEACALGVLGQASVGFMQAPPAQARISVLTGARVSSDGEMPEPIQRVIDARGMLDGLPAMGPVDAPVTLVEYNDFQCVFCAQAARNAILLTQRYPTQLRVVFRNAPLPFHADAKPAALAALAAHMQGKFWPMHDLLFANQQRLDRDALIGYAGSIGVDMARFLADLNGAPVAQLLAADLNAYKGLGARGTPIMTVNGKVIIGARPIDEIAAAIDEALKP